MKILHDEPGHNRVEGLWGFLSVHEHGEGICGAFVFSDHVATPLVCSTAVKPEQLAGLRQHARSIAKASGRPVRLVKFTRAEVCEVIQP